MNLFRLLLLFLLLPGHRRMPAETRGRKKCAGRTTSAGASTRATVTTRLRFRRSGCCIRSTTAHCSAGICSGIPASFRRPETDRCGPRLRFRRFLHRRGRSGCLCVGPVAFLPRCGGDHVQDRALHRQAELPGRLSAQASRRVYPNLQRSPERLPDRPGKW